MVSLKTLRDWLSDHGYRDLYPRRDASSPGVLFYVFVKEGRPRLGVRVVRGTIKQATFDRIQQAVRDAEQDD